VRWVSAGAGRRERAYPEDTGATEDEPSRRQARPGGPCFFPSPARIRGTEWRSERLSESSASPLLGWRAWCLRVDGRLQSVLYDDVWEPGCPLVAACPHEHAAPCLECACGIYAARRPEDALVYLTGRDEPEVVGRLLGRVALWGLVVEGEHGWRGQHAYPFELPASDVARRYRVRPCREIPRSTSSAPR
jgi:hypothetical protein